MVNGLLVPELVPNVADELPSPDCGEGASPVPGPGPAPAPESQRPRPAGRRAEARTRAPAGRPVGHAPARGRASSTGPVRHPRAATSAVRRAARRSSRPGMPAAPDRPLRLTGRGRAVVIVVLALVVVGAFTAGRGSAAATPARPGPVGGPHDVHRVLVQPGDTLWHFAEQVAPRSDPRGVVERLRRLNHLRDWRLTEGQVLTLP